MTGCSGLFVAIFSETFKASFEKSSCQISCSLRRRMVLVSWAHPTRQTRVLWYCYVGCSLVQKKLISEPTPCRLVWTVYQQQYLLYCKPVGMSGDKVWGLLAGNCSKLEDLEQLGSSSGGENAELTHCISLCVVSVPRCPLPFLFPPLITFKSYIAWSSRIASSVKIN